MPSRSVSAGCAFFLPAFERELGTARRRDDDGPGSAAQICEELTHEFYRVIERDAALARDAAGTDGARLHVAAVLRLARRCKCEGLLVDLARKAGVHEQQLMPRGNAVEQTLEARVRQAVPLRCVDGRLNTRSKLSIGKMFLPREKWIAAIAPREAA